VTQGRSGNVARGPDGRMPQIVAAEVGSELESPAELIGRAFARTVELMAENSAAESDVVRSDVNQAVSLDASFLEVVTRAAEAMSTVMEAALKGVSFAVIVGDDGLMTSQEAADLLNVSRPYVTKLAREGRIAHQMVGTHHRFTRADVLAQREQMRADRTDALRDLAPAEGYQDSDF
jgi:excisionase family DNA binding protein